MEIHVKAIADELKKIRLELQYQNELSKLPPLEQTDLPKDDYYKTAKELERNKAKIAQQIANGIETDKW